MRFGGIVLVTALTLGACSSDPAPIEPSRSATTPAPTPTATAPAMPDQARDDSPEGAAAFVKHYVDVFNYAAATGDVEELTRLSAPTCEGCQSYITLYRDTYAAGGYFKGGEWALSEINLEAGERDTYVTSEVSVAAGTTKTTSEAKEAAEEGERQKISFAARRGSNGWQLLQLGLGDVE